MRKTLRLAILFATPLFLVACVTLLSQEEAREVTLATTPQTLPTPSLASPTPTPLQRAFTPPPRSIRDILAVLEQPGKVDAERLERLRRELLAPLPSIEADGYRAEFYFRKGNAAIELGQEWQALQNYRLAYDHMRKAGEERLDILRSLAMAEQNLGHFKQAVALLERCREIDDVAVTHEYAQSYDQRLLQVYLAMGNLQAAEQSLERGRVFCAHEIVRGSRYSHLPWGRVNSPWDKQRKAAACAQMEARFAEYHQRFPEAEAHWRLQLEKRIEIGQPGGVIGARMQLAGNLRRQGRLPEAELEARTALSESVATSGRQTAGTANAARGLAQILRDQDRRDDAEKLAQAAVRILEGLGVPDDAQRMQDARMLYGELLLRGYHDNQAKAQFDRVKMGLGKHPLSVRKAFANPHTILAAIRTGAIGEALELISTALETERAIYGPEHHRIARIVGLRAMAQAAKGETRKALEDFASASIRGKNSRHFISQAILEGYIDLLSRLAETSDTQTRPFDPANKAFALAGQLRQGTTETALNEACARLDAATNPALEALSRQDQALQARIATLETALADSLALPPSEQDRTVVERHIRDLGQLRETQEALWRRLKAQFPSHMKWRQREVVTVAAAQGQLRPGEALIVLHPAREQTFVWAVPPQGGIAFARVPLGEKPLEEVVRELRRALDIHPRRIGEIPPFDLAKAHDLYRALLEPVAAGWRGATDLIVVAKGPLGQLPLSLLPTSPVDPRTFSPHQDGYFGGYRRVPWLVRQASLTVLPSVASLVNLRAATPGDPRRRAFAGFGDPLFRRDPATPSRLTVGMTVAAQDGKKLSEAVTETPVAVRSVRIAGKDSLDGDRVQTSRVASLDRLPDTADEITAIAAVLGADPQRDVFLGEAASEERVKGMDLSDRKVLAFATHALVPRDIDGLEQPALALSAPDITGGDGDGLLTLEEILRLRLNADWVVLSGCNTGAAAGTGSESLSGLGSAFFYAGARALLASMWPLETTSGRRLATGIFEAQREVPTLSRAQAVRRSMLRLIDRENLIDGASGRVAASYAHPFFWAPFVLVGDGR